MPFSIDHLHFTPTPLALALGLLALGAIATLGVIAVRRSIHRGRTAALEALRFVIALLVVLLLWKPEWRHVVDPETRPRIVLLHDESTSMTTLDAVLPEALDPGQAVVTRAEWVERMLGGDLEAALAADGANEVLRQPFATPDGEGLAGTDLSTPILELLGAETSLRAVVLLTDGDYNLGQPPVFAAQKLLQRGVPLFAVPVGSEQRLPDLDLLAVNAPTYGIVGEKVQIPFTVRSSLDREVRATVRLRDEAGGTVSKDIVLPPGRETYETVLWNIDHEGSNTLELSLPVVEGERIATNNARRFTLTGRPESIRVLLVDTLPRWEYRYLRNALSRDPGVELSCLLFHPQLGPGDGPDYIQAFPGTPEELARFDVVMLGDVGVAPDQLTAEQCTLIKGLVENQASGVVFLPGPQGNQRSLLDTPLGELLPVVLQPETPEGIVDPVASPLELTGEGRASLLTLLADSEEQNPQVWRSLPGFYWHAAAAKAKAGTEVLAVHANRRTAFGPTPIIVTAAAGNGKVLYMGMDSAWRWRRGVEDKYHYRFWGQVARWMSYQRNMAAGQRVRLYYAPERPEPGDLITLNANAFDANGAPLDEGRVVVDVTAPDSESTRVELEKNDSAWGAYHGRLRIDQPGEWTLRAGIADSDAEAVTTTLLAQGVELEKVGQPARPEVLEEMAHIARGRLLSGARLASLADEIRALPDPRPIERRHALLSQWTTIVTLLVLLSLFWIGRKLNGTF